jgi:hypothetical protein
VRFPIRCTRGNVRARRATRTCRMLGATCEYWGRKPITSSSSRNSEAGAAVSVVVPLVGFTGAWSTWAGGRGGWDRHEEREEVRGVAAAD